MDVPARQKLKTWNHLINRMPDPVVIMMVPMK